MKDGRAPVTSPDDPRIAGIGASEIAGSDQLDGMLAMTPDERLDALVAMVAFTRELRGGRINSARG